MAILAKLHYFYVKLAVEASIVIIVVVIALVIASPAYRLAYNENLN